MQNIVNELQEKLSKVTVEKYSSEVSLELKQLKEKLERLVEVNEDLKKVKAKQKLQVTVTNLIIVFFNSCRYFLSFIKFTILLLYKK